MTKKTTKKQEDEINFLSTKVGHIIYPTAEDKSNYLDIVVKGKEHIDISCLKGELLPLHLELFVRKRKFEISLAMWKEDIPQGLLFVHELKEDFNHPYINKLVTKLHPLQVNIIRLNTIKKINNYSTKIRFKRG